MSIQGLRRFLVGGPVLKIILWVLIGVFVVGLAAIFSVPGSNMRSSQQPEGEVAEGAVIAKINGEPLTRAEYEQAYKEFAGGQQVGIGQLWYARQFAYDSAVREQLLLADAKAKGVRVTKRDVNKQLATMVDTQLAQLKQGAQGQDLEQRYGMIYSQMEQENRPKMSERQFRKWMTQYLRERYAEQAEKQEDDL